MPILQIDTNVQPSKIPSDFGIKTAELMADMFSTPKNFSVVHVNANQNIYWHGVDGCCVLGTLKIVGGSGKITPEQNVKHAQVLVKHIVDYFKIPDKNISISFVEQEASNVTVFSTTVLAFLQN
ncbi:macrophage migration inhibitory factor homolog [Adelges cooleyi]|uniref:macrophage migration inhibitory factor homolog n=1 Tax=Adelges cooleyi TaxID=133065 RepID=UPI0021805B35|nr:macrophage migration inhibitory factor homolog [Adelges cooleyi]XP_050431105.1 macrophage migration inhibitory factor homolog [Adelges cooleyi]XP_050431112.1 macrophage migration inhibitory factor homolog [Adelges cooleyi]